MALLNTTRWIDWYKTSPMGLLLAAFLFSFNIAVVGIALPWRVMGLGGESVAVGSIGALMVGVYMITCVLIGGWSGRFSAKSRILFCLIATMTVTVSIPLAPSVGLVLALVGCNGAMLTFFWPPLMVWLSAGTEGPTLSRRLSIFNLSWSSGGIVGSYLGGLFFAVAYWLPFVFSVAILSVAFLSILILRETREQSSDVKSNPNSDLQAAAVSERQILFRRILHIGLMVCWLAFAALRVPIASLIHDMDFGSQLHAILSGGGSLIMMISFFLLGRWVGWHYKLWIIVVAQLMLVTALIGVSLTQTSGALIVFVFLAAPSLSFFYSSHLFYCVSGFQQRQKGANLHEILLSISFGVGSFGGGTLGYFIGMRNVYFVIAMVIAAGLVAQCLIFYLVRAKFALKKPIPIPSQIVPENQ